MSSTFLNQAVAEHSSRHTQLLNSLSELESVPGALKDQTALVEELQSQLEECETNVAKLFEKTRRERRNADPGLIPSKFSLFKGRKEKEREREREERNKKAFAEAMAEETKERDRQASLEQSLNKSQVTKSDLMRRMKEYDDIEGKIDALYGLIFNGPTPGYPQEDELEQSVQASYSVIERKRAEFNSENESFEYLSRAERALRECQSKMKDAIYWATASMLAGGRTAESKETASLRIAHSLAQRALALVRDSQQYSAHVRSLETPGLAREMPVRSENDTEFHEVLKASAAELANTYSQLFAERKASADRCSDAKAALHEAEQMSSDRKKELRELRKTTFLEVVSKLKSGELSEPSDLDFEGLHDAPPSYDQPPPPPSLPPLLMAMAKQDHSHGLPRGPSTSVSTHFPSNHFGYEGPSSPVSMYTASSSQHSSFYADSTPLPTPSSTRPGGGRPRTARPLPRVPQQNPG